jgi:hypothetical protein
MNETQVWVAMIITGFLLLLWILVWGATRK